MLTGDSDCQSFNVSETLAHSVVAEFSRVPKGTSAEKVFTIAEGEVNGVITAGTSAALREQNSDNVIIIEI
jgi:hypothetical protein